MTRVLIVALFAALTAAASVGCDGGEAPVESGESVEVADHASVTLEVDGMDCVNCAQSIEESFDETDGVVAGSVDFGARTADVEYDPETLDESDIVNVVEEAGFEAVVIGES